MDAELFGAMVNQRELEVDLGYAEVNLLYAAGAECCMHYSANKIHDRCPWHHAFMAERIIRRFRRRAHGELLAEGKAFHDCRCDYCVAMNRVLDCKAALAKEAIHG